MKRNERGWRRNMPQKSASTAEEQPRRLSINEAIKKVSERTYYHYIYDFKGFMESLFWDKLLGTHEDCEVIISKDTIYFLSLIHI